jgi:hypothetical protein
MSNESKTSQVQHPFNAFGVRTLMDEQIERADAFQKEVAKLGEQGVAQLQSAITESTKLANAWIGYTTQLAIEARKISLEAGRLGVDLLYPRA